jgi:hypothetical protein
MFVNCLFFLHLDSTKIPKDGPDLAIYKDQTIYLDSSQGRTILSLQIMGFLSSLLSFIFITMNYKHRLIRAASPPFCYIIIFGTALIYISNLFSLGVPTSVSCQAGVYFGVLGFVLVFGAMIAKNYRIYFLFTSKNVVKKKYKFFKTLYPFMGLLGVLVTLEVVSFIVQSLHSFIYIFASYGFNYFLYPHVQVLLLLWSYILSPYPQFILNKDTVTSGYICRTHLTASRLAIQSIEGALYTYNSVILAGTSYLAYLTRNVTDSFRESMITFLIVFATSLSGLIVIPEFNSSEVSMHNTLMKNIVIWALTTFTLVLLFGSKALAVRIYNRNNQMNYVTSNKFTWSRGAGVVANKVSDKQQERYAKQLQQQGGFYGHGHGVGVTHSVGSQSFPHANLPTPVGAVAGGSNHNSGGGLHLGYTFVYRNLV